jgi:hypothetical protein
MNTAQQLRAYAEDEDQVEADADVTHEPPSPAARAIAANLPFAGQAIIDRTNPVPTVIIFKPASHQPGFTLDRVPLATT